MPRTILENLMKQAVPVAERLLEQHGSFLPYGAVLNQDDKLEMIGGKSEEEYASTDDLIEAVLTRLKTAAEDEGCTALAVVLDVKVTPPGQESETDAIRAILEHNSGLNIESFIPYAVREDGTVEYGEMFAFPGKPRFF